MAYEIEPDEDLRSPWYWDGVDPFKPHEDAAQAPEPVVLPGTEWAKAGAWLVGALEDATAGRYWERQLPILPDPVESLSDHPDGTVVVVEHENMLSWTRTRETSATFAAPRDGVPVSRPFVPYWLENQQLGVPTEMRPDIGVNMASFDGHNQIYTRVLRWGVLMSDANGGRVMPMWQFNTPKFTLDGITLPVPIEVESNRVVREVREPPELTDKVFAMPEFNPMKIVAKQLAQRHLAERQSSLGGLVSVQAIGRLLSAHILYTPRGVMPDAPDISSFQSSG